MWTDVARKALTTGTVLQLQYDGYVRLVEVHAVGINNEHHIVMRVWQIRSGSSSDELSGWKLLRLDEVSRAALTLRKSCAPRQGYKRGDPAIQWIIYQL
jgi:hypothetical protein